MKKLLLATMIMTSSFSITTGIAFAQSYNEHYSGDNTNSSANIDPMDIPDYLGADVVPLTSKELKALQLNSTFAKNSLAPFAGANGKIIYVHGASVVSVLASPMQVCDVELQAGEVVNEIIVGDSARWMVEAGQAGNTTHIFVKPVDAGLKTNAIITTNRRVYHLQLISSRYEFTPYIGFAYSNEIKTYSNQKQSMQAQEAHYNSTTIDNAKVELADLNFNYRLKGKAPWKPERVYDNGVQTFMQLPEKTTEMPVLLVKKGRENILVNYRIKNKSIIADGIFEEMVLVIGVGRNKQQITITKD